MNNAVNVHTVVHHWMCKSWWIAAGLKRLHFKLNRCSKSAQMLRQMAWPKVKMISAERTMKSYRSIVAHANVAFVHTVRFGVVPIRDIHSSNSVSSFFISVGSFPYPVHQIFAHFYATLFPLTPPNRTRLRNTYRSSQRRSVTATESSHGID